MEEQTQFTMRLPNSLYSDLKKLAEENKRSIAKELEYIVEKRIEKDKLNKERAKNIAKMLREKKLSSEELSEYKEFFVSADSEFATYLLKEI